MIAYTIRRLLLMIPTLLGIMIINFAVVQAAPGGPVEQAIARIKGTDHGATARFAGHGGESSAGAGSYRGARGIDPEVIKQIEKMYGFDKPPLTRLTDMIARYATFDFGSSFARDTKVVDLIADKLPVSISLGLWTTLLIYLISIPLGIAKAVRDGSSFDVWTSGIIILGYAVPSFLFALLLVVLFAGGSFWHLFPLRGMVSDDWLTMNWPHRILDYFWHMALPITALVIGGFASLTLLTKNSFLDEIGKHYVVTARAKGLTEHRVLYGHVFRNAMLIVISGFPAAFIGILFTSALLTEVIFSLDGLGLLGFESAINRDYPVLFGSLYIFTLLGLVTNLIGDLIYTAVDPRIDFSARAK